MSPQVRLVYLILVQYHASVAFFFSPYRRQHGWTCNFWPYKRQHGWTCRSGSLREPRISRKTIALFIQNAADWLHLIYMVLVPVPHSHSKRHQASSRASPWSWRHARRRGSRAAGARCCLYDAHAMFNFPSLPHPSVCFVMSKWYLRRRIHEICEWSGHGLPARCFYLFHVAVFSDTFASIAPRSISCVTVFLTGAHGAPNLGDRRRVFPAADPGADG